jgi:hypothetical protein
MTFLSGNMSEGSDFGSWSLEDGELESPLSWVDESSEDDLDYFVAFDLAASESPLRFAPREVPVTSTDAGEGDSRRQRMGVSKQSIGESSRSVKDTTEWAWRGPIFEVGHDWIRVPLVSYLHRYPGHASEKETCGTFLRGKS